MTKFLKVGITLARADAGARLNVAVQLACLDGSRNEQNFKYLPACRSLLSLTMSAPGDPASAAMLPGEVTVTPEPSDFAHDGWALEALDALAPLEAIGAVEALAPPEVLVALEALDPHPAIARMAIVPATVSPLRTFIDISPGKCITHDSTEAQEGC